MIEGLVVTGLNGKEKRLRKTLKILGDDSWSETSIKQFVDKKAIGLVFHSFSYVYYVDGDRIPNYLTVIPYKELKALGETSVGEKTPIYKKVKMIDVLKMCLEGKTVRTEKKEYWVEDGSFCVGTKGSSFYMYTHNIEISELKEEVEILDENN